MYNAFTHTHPPYRKSSRDVLLWNKNATLTCVTLCSLENNHKKKYEHPILCRHLKILLTKFDWIHRHGIYRLGLIVYRVKQKSNFFFFQFSMARKPEHLTKLAFRKRNLHNLCVCGTRFTWRWEDNSQGSILSFTCAGSGVPFKIIPLYGSQVLFFFFEIHSSNKGHLDWFPILIIITETTLSTTI